LQTRAWYVEHDTIQPRTGVRVGNGLTQRTRTGVAGVDDSEIGPHGIGHYPASSSRY
jgi:hypothetical protein